MAAELDVQYFDRNVGLAIGRLQLAQVERLVHRAHAAKSQALLEHEAAVEGVADALDALRLGVALLGNAGGGRPGPPLRPSLHKGFVGAQLLPRLRSALYPALRLRVHLGRQGGLLLFLAEDLEQARGAPGRRRDQSV